MKTTCRRTALILILLLTIESFSAAFAFADDSVAVPENGQTENSEEQQSGTEDNAQPSSDGSTPQDDGAQPSADGSTPQDDGAQPSADGSEQQGEDGTTPEPGKEDETPAGEGEVQPEPLNGWVTKKNRTYYYVEGVYLTGMQKIDNAWYYFSQKGVRKTGFIKVDNSTYYFDADSGKRVKGKKTINGSVYYFRKNGVMTVGWLKIKNRRFYHNAKGERLFGSWKIGKFKYYFKPKSGAMKTGWLKLKGKRYYFTSKGHKVFGIRKINGKKYYFNLNTGARMDKGKYFLYKKVWNKSSSTNYLIYIDKKGKWVNVYKGRKKAWTLIRRNRCTIGSGSTPTPSGTFKVTSKVYHFGEQKGYTCWYATGFIGVTYLMHSVVCYRGTKVPSDGRLGVAVSHGCVRMKLSNAKWIYDHIPHESTVYIA